MYLPLYTALLVVNEAVNFMKRIAKKGGVKKEEVHFIATRYRNGPLNVSFYTKDGKQIAEEAVEKKRTREGVKLFAMVPQ